MKYRILFLSVLCMPLYSMPRQKTLKKYDPIVSVAAAVQKEKKEQAARAVELKALSAVCANPQVHRQEKKMHDDTINQIVATIPTMPHQVAQLIVSYLSLLTTWHTSRFLVGHTKAILNMTRFTNSDKTETLFSASADGSIKKWDLGTGDKPVDTFSPWGLNGGNVKNILITPSGSLTASNGSAGLLALCSTDLLLRDRYHLKWYVTSMALLSSGQIACVAHTVQERRKNTIIILDPEDTHLVDPRVKPIVRIILTEYHSIECIAPLAGGCFAIGCLNDWTEITEDGEREHVNVPTIALLNPDDYEGDNRRENELEGADKPIYVLKVLADGRIASGSSDKSIIIWDIPTRSMRKILIGHTTSISCIEQLPDGDLISADFDGNIIIWDIETGLLKYRLNDGSGAVRTIALGLHDSFVSAGDDTLIKIWEQKPCPGCARAVVQPAEQEAPKTQKTSLNRWSCCTVM